jgi:NADH-quinone oxidoreductase subunit L
MFLALGVGAWSAAIFHLMAHAFFKALLFLSAGVVIMALHDEHNIHKMGGLRNTLPVAFWTFLIGSASLAALPLVTAGFFSKDLILWYAWSSPQGGPWLWVAGWLGALLTGLYIFRVVFIVFFGRSQGEIVWRPGWVVKLPLLVLAALSVAGGWIELPRWLGHVEWFTDYVTHALPAATAVRGNQNILQWLSVGASLGGIGLAWLLFMCFPRVLERFMQGRTARVLRNYWHLGWGFDWLYDRALVRPYRWLTRDNRQDPVDAFYTGVAQLCVLSWHSLSASQNGQLRRYAMVIASGGVIIAAIMLFA